MLPKILLLSCAAFGLIATMVSAGLDPEITKGLEGGDRLLTAIENKDFTAAVELIPIVSEMFIKGLMLLVTKAASDSHSREAAQMRQLFTEYNQRLRAMSEEYSNVRSLVDWNSVRVAYGSYERSIVALKVNIQQVLEAPADAQSHQIRFFITLFESDYQNAASKIYTSLTDQHMLFSDNLVKAVRKYTRDHRYMVRQFLLGVYKLLLEGVEVEATYMTFMNYTQGGEYIRRHWETKLNSIQPLYEAIDKEIKDRWFQQSSLDIDYFSNENGGLNKAQYATKLFNFLSEKFQNRFWMVLIYDEVWGFNNHAVTDCKTTVIRFRQNGKNVVVASIDKKDSKFSPKSARSILESLPPRMPIFYKDKPLYFLNDLMEKAGFKDDKCEKYAFAAVLKDGVNHALMADPGHFMYRVHGSIPIMITHKFKTFLFG